ncbi:MAG: gliding motility protein GldL [Bacteroidales bacterium]|nr:gliding motility protein GldL [Bacteroidales bacterium]MCF8337224.1 gliding motility protein GldL [Bacteroidales bacterium]
MAKKTKKKKSFINSHAFNNVIGRLYGFGASVVILGALFKIQHYEGANIMLPIGLGMETLIFFITGLQKPHVEPDWSRVYPEFIELYHTEEEAEQLREEGRLPEKGSKTQFGGGSGGGGNGSSTVDHLMEKVDIDKKTIEKFGKGIEKFTNQTEKLSDISEATVATDQYIQNIKKASGAAEKMSESLEGASETVSNEFQETGDYSQNVKKASQAAANLADMYSKTSESVKKEGDEYSEAVTKLKDNLNALNSVYELQLQESDKQKESAKKMSQNVESFMNNLDATNKVTEEYQKQVNILTEKVTALNNVYGNMLSAMNVNTTNT